MILKAFKESSGTFFDVFHDLESGFGSVFLKSYDKFQITWKSERYGFLFPHCSSVINIQTKKEAIQEPVDGFHFLCIPPNHVVQLMDITLLNSFSIFSVEKYLIDQMIEKFNLSHDQVYRHFQTITILKINNWLNEVVHRLKYEKTKPSVPNDQIINFLQPEILKEIYYRFEQRNQKDLYRFDITQENLSQKSPITQKAIMKIEACLFKNLSVDDLVRDLATSESTLLRNFKNDMGKSPMNYLKERRLDESLLMLKSNRYSVAEVGEIIGYVNTSAFISVFKKRFQKTPSQITIE